MYFTEVGDFLPDTFAGGEAEVSDGDGDPWQHTRGYCSITSWRYAKPLVWQQDNVAIVVFQPTDHQRDMSDRTHAFWPWDQFDAVSSTEANGGVKVAGNEVSTRDWPRFEPPRWYRPGCARTPKTSSSTDCRSSPPS